MLTFTDLDKATDRVGNALLAGGLRSGDRVGVLLPNGIDGLVVFYALAKAGLVRVPLNVRETPADHAYKLTDSGPGPVIAEKPDDFGVATISTVFDCGHASPRSWPAAPTCPAPSPATPTYRSGSATPAAPPGGPRPSTLTMRCEHAEIASFLIDLLPEVRPGDRMLHAAPGRPRQRRLRPAPPHPGARRTCM